MARRDQRIFKRRRFTRFRGNALWPVLMAVLSVCGLLLAYLFVFKLAVPFIGALFTDKREVIVPTSTPEQMGDLSDHIREILLNYKFKHVSYPVILGDDIFFASGSDNAQNPKLNKIFSVQTVNSNVEEKIAELEGIEAECGYILHLDAGASFIVYFDGYNTGGGLLKLYDRATKQTKTLCKIDYGSVVPKLSGTKCVFLQRVSNSRQVLYSMDVITGEVTTLHVYVNSPLGKTQPGVSSKNVVYVAENPKLTDSERYNMIYIQSFDGSLQTFDPGLYAYSPVTCGTAIAFTDRMQGGALYLSVNGSMQKKIAQNVSGYGLAEHFLAWCEQGRIYVYFWQQDKVYRVSKAGEYAMLASVSAHAVAWFDITAQVRERDILKFAVLD